MSKDRISATIDEEVAKFVERDDVNTSGLVNKLLRQHMSGATGREQMLELRLDQVKEDIREMEGRLENKRNELDRLEEELDKIHAETTDALDEAAKNLTRLDFKNQSMKVSHYMEEANVTFEELREEVQERWST